MANLNPKAMKRFSDKCREEECVCWICEEEIDYDLPRDGTHPWGFTVDHFKTQSGHPEDKNKEENLRPSHYLCNNRRGNRPPRKSIWFGSKEMGRWTGESDKRYERRIAKEELRFGILTDYIRDNEMNGDLSHFMNQPPLTNRIQIGER